MAATTPPALAEVYEHWGRGDFSPRFAVYADDFEWGWSTQFPEEGVRHEDETPNPRLREWLSPWEHWVCAAEGYVEKGDSVVIFTRYQGRGKASGAGVDVEGAHVWRMRHGQAVRLEVFSDREAALASVEAV